MILGYAAVIADEVGKASRSRSQTSQAMCALKTPKRLGLTGTPLENDYDEPQTLLKCLDIKPWNDRKVFNEYFVSKRPKKSKARTLKGERSAILSTSLRACVFPLRIDDTFNGERLVEFSRAIENHTLVTISPLESAHQKDAKQLWDRKSLMRWSRIEPWNDIKVFNDYFVTRKPKKAKAKTLKGVRNAILSTSLRACFFTLAIDDTFNGGRLVEFSRHSVRNTKLTLQTAEAAHRKETRPIWGKQKRGKDREPWSEKLRVWACHRFSKHV